MSRSVQVRIAGIGGQGAVIAADLIGEAALLEGKQVAGSSRYGSAARGTPVRADLVLAEEPVDDPHVHAPDVLVAMCQEAYDLYLPSVPAGGMVIYDDGDITPKEIEGVVQHGLPALQIAVKQVGNRQTANLVLLGALIALTDLLPRKSVEQAIVSNVRERFHEVNKQALGLGHEQGRQIGGKS